MQPARKQGTWQMVQGQQTINPGEPSSEPAKAEYSFWARPLVIIIGSVILAFLFFLGLGYLVHSFTHEGTDDAFLDGPIISVRSAQMAH